MAPLMVFFSEFGGNSSINEGCAFIIKRLGLVDRYTMVPPGMLCGVSSTAKTGAAKKASSGMVTISNCFIKRLLSVEIELYPPLTIATFLKVYRLCAIILK